MKKFLKIFVKSILWLLLIVIILVITVPLLFKKQILEFSKKKINENVHAKVEFADLKINMVQGFPNLYIALEDLTVVGIEDFEGDTLVSFDKFSVTVDLVSAIKRENIKVKAIMLEHPVLNGKILPDGKANWDIAPPSDTTEVEEQPDTAASSMDMNIQLKKFEITDADISYDDQSSKMLAVIKDLDFKLKGDMSKDFTKLDLNTSINSIIFKMDGVKYLNNASFSFKALLAADMKKMLFSIQDNEIALNQLVLGLSGMAQMAGDDIITDIKFQTRKTDFKTLLSLVPAVYMADFQDIQTSGSLQLTGFLKGTMTETGMPDAGIDLIVENAMFKYPALPKSAENININLNVAYNGTDADKTVVNLKKFHVDLGGNPLDMDMVVKTPMSDPQISGNIIGKVDLNTLKDIIPLEDATITGIFESNVKLNGRLSSIEAEKYEEFDASGSLKLTSFNFKSADFPQGVVLNEVLMNFNPKFVELANFDAKIGRSDIKLKGNLENFLAYMFSDGIVSGNLELKSNQLDLNEFLGGSESEEAPVEETEEATEMSVFEVPKNINFNFSSSIAKIKYDKMDITNVLGTIKMGDSKVEMSNLSMNMLDGSMVLNGEYNTQNPAKPFVDFGMAISNFDIAKAYDNISLIQQYAPIAENCTGKFSTSFKFNSSLDKTMMPVFESVQGTGNFKTANIVLDSPNTLKKLSEQLKYDKLKKLKLQNVGTLFEILNGRIYLKPFEIKDGTTKMMVSGDQGIDQTMNYTMNLKLPTSQLGPEANKVMDDLMKKAGKFDITIDKMEEMLIDVMISGTFTDPKITIAFKQGEELLDNLKDQVEEKAKEEVQKVIDDTKEKAKAEADKIIKEAEKQAQKIKAEAKKAADLIRSQAREQSNALIKKASNPIAKKAAEKAGEEIVKEADNKAKKLEREAENKASQVIAKAKQQAAKLN